jgi:hypothetical protein
MRAIAIIGETAVCSFIMDASFSLLVIRVAWRSARLDRVNNRRPLYHHHPLDSSISPNLATLCDVLVSTLWNASIFSLVWRSR